MSNKKQTSIDFLLDQLDEKFSFKLVMSDMLEDEDKTEYYELIDQAKAMEKEQIIDAFDNGLAFGFDDAWHGVESIDSTQYYKETYGE